MKTILLHCCCAPCAAYVINLLENTYSIVAYFYNPNIHPLHEYKKRQNELKRYSSKKRFPLIEGEYDERRWFKEVKEYRFMGERSLRCRRCISIRLEKTFEKAKEKSITVVGTTLTISPHKDSTMINEIGCELSKKFGIEFFVADFKKNDGFKKTIEISKIENFYRQKYCGCIYSNHPIYRVQLNNKIFR
ncbi:MAG: epoxyqueuosine reductase QueH [Spirochaetes bacterium]|nr:epoxyqueuosine reductase QueH [Spirochaetota bacterium]